MSRYELHLAPLTETLRELYEKSDHHHEGDAGFDLYLPDDFIAHMGDTGKARLGVKAAMWDRSLMRYVSYYMYARSSISKTPYMLHNGTGIIDSGYRGELMAALIRVGQGENALISAHTRLIQICAPDLSSFDVKLVSPEDLGETSRGEGGFGSTGAGGGEST